MVHFSYSHILGRYIWTNNFMFKMTRFLTGVWIWSKFLFTFYFEVEHRLKLFKKKVFELKGRDLEIEEVYCESLQGFYRLSTSI